MAGEYVQSPPFSNGYRGFLCICHLLDSSRIAEGFPGSDQIRASGQAVTIRYHARQAHPHPHTPAAAQRPKKDPPPTYATQQPPLHDHDNPSDHHGHQSSLYVMDSFSPRVPRNLLTEISTFQRTRQLQQQRTPHTTSCLTPEKLRSFRPPTPSCPKRSPTRLAASSFSTSGATRMSRSGISR